MTSLLCLTVPPAGCGPCDLPAGVLWLMAATCNSQSRVRHDAHRPGEMWADLYRYHLPCSGVTCCCSPLVWGCFFYPEVPEASWDHEMPLEITSKLMIMSFIFWQKVEKDYICVWEGRGVGGRPAYLLLFPLDLRGDISPCLLFLSRLYIFF